MIAKSAIRRDQPSICYQPRVDPQENHVVEAQVHVNADVQDAESDESTDSDGSFGSAEESADATDVLLVEPAQPLDPSPKPAEDQFTNAGNETDDPLYLGVAEDRPVLAEENVPTVVTESRPPNLEGVLRREHVGTPELGIPTASGRGRHHTKKFAVTDWATPSVTKRDQSVGRAQESGKSAPL